MNNTAFAILSGGKNSRIGVNKAFLEINSQTIIERMIKIAKTSPQSMIITNEPEMYENFGIEIYTDIFRHRGPISGIHSALKNSKFENVFVISCDMPFVSLTTIYHIINSHNDSEISLPVVADKTYFVCGVYSKKTFEKLDDYLIQGPELSEEKNRYYALYQFEKMFDINKIKMDELLVDTREFTNINTMEEWERIKSTC